MAVYLKEFQTRSQYETYINSSDAILPNVSICTTEGEVHYNPIETRVVAKFNVTDTSNPTQIVGASVQEAFMDSFSAIEIDGVEQPSVVSAHTFSTTGEHTVKYTLTDPTSIGSYAFFRCSGLTSIVMPNSVTSIGESAFSNCTSLTSCTIGSGVTRIVDRAFNGCTSLISIDIPDSVTSIGDAFGGCYSLTSCTIGSGVTSIGGGAFNSCRGLTSIVSNAATAPTISFITFLNVKTGGTLTVPIGSTGYDVWMGTGDYYLGKYSWTKVEQ